MKPMNFNFVGKLPILLAKKPFTTIRKATEEEIKDLSDEELNDELLRPTGVWKEDVLRESIRRILLK